MLNSNKPECDYYIFHKKLDYKNIILKSIESSQCEML